MNKRGAVRLVLSTCVAFAALVLPLTAAERGGFQFDLPSKWTEDIKPEGDGLASYKEPGGRAWIYHLPVKASGGRALEQGLLQLLGAELGTHLKELRLSKLDYCDEQTKLSQEKKPKDKGKDKSKDKKKKKDKGKDKKKKDKDKKKKDKGDSTFCKNPTYWGKGKAKTADDKKLRFRFVVVEKEGSGILLVAAAKHEYAKEKEKDKELRKVLQSVR